MHLKPHHILAVLIFLLVIASVNLLQSQEKSEMLQTVRLTDRDLSVHDALGIDIAPANNGLHVSWKEYTVFDLPEYATAVFYAHLPSGNVKMLTDPEQTILKSSAFFPKIATDSQGRAYVIWIEYVTDELTDLFFWKTGMDNPSIINNRDVAAGSVSDAYLVIDQNDRAHVLWEQRKYAGSPQWTEVFYWLEDGEVIPLTDTGEATHSRALWIDKHDDIAHVLYHDFAVSAKPQPYYWNSATQTSVGLFTEELEGSFGDHQSSFLNDEGVVHVLWYEQIVGSRNYLHWDSVTQQNSFIMNLPLTIPGPSVPQLYKDGEGNAHIVYQEENTAYHWDSVYKSQQAFVFQSGELAAVAGGTIGNTIHLVWIGQQDSLAGGQDDVFYWRSDMDQPLNVSAPMATADADGYLSLVIDQFNTAHLAWEQEGGYYFNSLTGNTVPVTGPVSTVGSPQSEVFLIHQDVAYWLLPAAEPNTEYPLYLWRSDTNELTPIPTIYETGSAMMRALWIDKNGEPHVAWQENVAGQGTNLLYWDMLHSTQELSDTEDTSGDVGQVYMASDKQERLYILWTEYVDEEHGRDLYAAYRPVVYTDHLYLPLVMQ